MFLCGRQEGDWCLGEHTVLAHLEIHAQVDRVCDDVVRPRSKVHVANRALWDHQASNHLGQVICRDAVAVPGVEQRTL